MNMVTFTPLFSTVVLSSLWDEEDWVVKVFMTLLALQDRDHVVRMSAYNIGKAARKDEATTLKALAVLSSPDKKRLEKQEHDGRRVERVEDGWKILNGEKYQEAMVELFRRSRNAERMRMKRAAERVRSRNVVTMGERVAEEEARQG